MAAKKPQNSYQQEMKELVAEQPGFFFSILGLVIALFFGLAVRALIAPEKVREKIIHASTRVHSDLQFEIGEAYISLADGILPELAVVIRNIKMTSEKACWMRPQADIEEIKLPLSFFNLLQGKVFVHELIATEAALSLRSAPVPCAKEAPGFEASERSTTEEASTINAGAVTRSVAQAIERAVIKNQTNKNVIDSVRVKKLIVSYLPVAFTSFELDNLSVKASAEKDFELSSLLKLGGGTLTGDYSSQAQLKINYKPSSGSAIWQSELRGLLREGHYDIFSSYDPSSQLVDLNLDVKHLPLSQIFPIMQKYKVFTSELNGKRMWLSLKAKASGKAQELKNAPVSISEFRVEGDLGEIYTKEIRIDSFAPFKMKSLVFDIHGLDVNHFLVFLNRPHPSQALGNLGIFNGQAYYQDPENIRLSGQHSGLQFIFSNKGFREVQTLSLVSGDLILRNNQWNVNVNEVRPSQGLFDGDLKIQASKDWRELVLNTNIREMILAPTVQKIMTDGGDIGSVSGRIDLDVKQGEVRTLKGNLQINRMLVEGIEMKLAKMKLSNSGTTYFVEANAQSMEMAANARIAKYVTQILPDSYRDQNLLLKTAKMKIKTEKLTDLYWSDFSTTLAGEKPVLVSSVGGWNQSGELSGNVRVRQNGKERSWLVGGTRENPALVQKNP